MRGTPRFVGERLKEAREARQISATTLAELIGKSRQAVSQYENDKQTPAPEVMRRITEVLRFPPHFFLRPVKSEQSGTIFYRSMSATTKAARSRAERRHGWLRETVQYLRRLLEFPVQNIPALDGLSDPAKLDDNTIEQIATDVRRHWKLQDGPISNVVWLLENNGVVVVRRELCAWTLDAFSEWSTQDSTPYVVLGTEKASAVRSRFDAAHELGHLVLHRKVPMATLSKPEMFKLIERQAHHFAGAFLLPASTFADASWMLSLDTFKSLKMKWRVSIQAMILRAAHLGLLVERRQEQLWQNLGRRRWRTQEPLDDVFEPEEPRLLRRSFDLLMANGVSPAHDLEIGYGYRPQDIEDVTGLPHGYLSNESSPQIIRLPDTAESAAAPSRQEERTVIRFPRNN